ncbi:hypothetical protein JB92DRAFT_3108506 [Gautieria morchelliformis]|nr:hypothetical protein JB92DRAFT_3108506 [Gautieria morchelliformis]
MQPASGDFALSQGTPRSGYESRRPGSFTTRRLSTAIDALRHEGEAILWEMNSLRTQILTLEQRIIGQTEELDMVARNLAALREQHRIMEQQYQDKLRVLRSELRAAQDGGQSTSAPSTNAPASECERCRSLYFPDSPQPFGSQHSHQHCTRHPPPPPALLGTQAPAIPVNYQEHTRYTANSKASADSVPPHSRSAVFQHSSTPPPLGSLSQSSPRRSPYDTQRRSPQANYKQSRTRPHDRHDPQRNDVASPTRHEPSLSPTLVGSCSDESRSRKRDHRF